jgi:hypothetical protein
MAHTYDTKAYLARGRSSSGRDLAITIGSGATVLVLGIVVDGLTARTGGAPTINSVALTQSDQNRQAASGETTVEQWHRLNPPAGSVTIHIPDNNNVYFTAEASSYKAASGKASALRTASGATGTSTNPTGPTHTGLASGDVIVAMVGSGATTWAPSGRTGTQLYDIDDSSYGDGAQYLIKTDANNTAMAWTFGTSDDWAIVSAVFKETTPVSLAGNLGGVALTPATVKVRDSRKVVASLVGVAAVPVAVKIRESRKVAASLGGAALVPPVVKIRASRKVAAVLAGVASLTLAGRLKKRLSSLIQAGAGLVITGRLKKRLAGSLQAVASLSISGRLRKRLAAMINSVATVTITARQLIRRAAVLTGQAMVKGAADVFHFVGQLVAISGQLAASAWLYAGSRLVRRISAVVNALADLIAALSLKPKRHLRLMVTVAAPQYQVGAAWQKFTVQPRTAKILAVPGINQISAKPSIPQFQVSVEVS